jgi:hypothetical protein
MAPIDEALKELSLLDKPNITAVANNYGVERSTLSRRYRKVNQAAYVAAEDKRFLTAQQEQSLVNYINKLTDRGLPPTPAMLRNFAYDLAGKEPGKCWSQRFCKRWNQQLKTGYLTAIDSKRQQADQKASYKRYFTVLKEKIEQYKVEPHNVYNMDEKGFLIGYLVKTKRVFNKDSHARGALLGTKQDGNREWITIIGSICADGTCLSPGLIYQAISGCVQGGWIADFDPSI